MNPPKLTIPRVMDVSKANNAKSRAGEVHPAQIITKWRGYPITVPEARWYPETGLRRKFNVSSARQREQRSQPAAAVQSFGCGERKAVKGREGSATRRRMHGTAAPREG